MSTISDTYEKQINKVLSEVKRSLLESGEPSEFTYSVEINIRSTGRDTPVTYKHSVSGPKCSVVGRYMLFGGEQHYPGGGVNDLISIFDNVDDAKKYLVDRGFKVLRDDGFYMGCTYIQWAHIYDVQTNSIIFRLEGREYEPETN